MKRRNNVVTRVSIQQKILLFPQVLSSEESSLTIETPRMEPSIMHSNVNLFILNVPLSPHFLPQELTAIQ